ncbi:MAG: DinB family protein [Bacteroidetes bacterium]|nr:DinB family protein [Bacteroidota bacterium]
MQEASNHLTETIHAAILLLQEISDEKASIKPQPNKWSYKEIIGHLIDSANNNIQKFIRTIENNGHHIPPYHQNEWVAIQNYNGREWNSILKLWFDMNEHIAHIMKTIPEASLNNELYIGDKGPFTLSFIVTDYTEHLKHHLKSILPDTSFLNSTFKMIY